MSEIKVDTLTGKTTANDITVTVGASATMSLEQGLAKIWVNFDGTASGATARDSLGLSSMSDIGTGNYSINYNNNMSNSNYAVTMNNRAGAGKQSIVTLAKDFTASTSIQRIYTVNPSSPVALQDEDFCMVSIHGDLA